MRPLLRSWQAGFLTQGIEAELERLLEPGVRALGLELWMLELVGSGHNMVLRVYIDGPDGITLDDCAAVSGQLSAILDVEDPIQGHYNLEVSSPGLDRPLAKPAHFASVIGEQVKVHLHTPVDTRRRFTGRVLAVGDDALSIEVDGETIELPFVNIQKARLVPA